MSSRCGWAWTITGSRLAATRRVVPPRAAERGPSICVHKLPSSPPQVRFSHSLLITGDSGPQPAGGTLPTGRFLGENTRFSAEDVPWI